MASHLGCDRDPMVIAWPGRIAAGGDLRTQFTHCIDIAPTLLDMIGIPEPTTVDGVAQEPMDGTSFAYTFDDAEVDERHTLQYFEMYGSRAIYQDGWWACTRLDKAPWDFSPATLQRFSPYDTSQDVWELYYLPDDFSQSRDIAADHPEKLAELQEVFWQEAERNKVLPLLGGLSVFFGDLPPMSTVTRYTYHGDVENVSTTLLPRIYGRSYAIEAELHVPKGGEQGVLCAFADHRTSRRSDRTLERAVSPSTSGPSQPPVASDGRVRANRISTATRRPCSAVPMLRSAPPQHTMGYPSPIRSEAEIRARLSGGIPERSAWAVPE